MALYCQAAQLLSQSCSQNTRSSQEVRSEESLTIVSSMDMCGCQEADHLACWTAAAKDEHAAVSDHGACVHLPRARGLPLCNGSDPCPVTSVEDPDVAQGSMHTCPSKDQLQHAPRKHQLAGLSSTRAKSHVKLRLCETSHQQSQAPVAASVNQMHTRQMPLNSPVQCECLAGGLPLSTCTALPSLMTL